MRTVLLSLQIIFAICLTGAILIQAKGTGLGSAWGGGGELYRSKRGVEKVFYKATIILSVLFLATSIANVLVG